MHLYLGRGSLLSVPDSFRTNLPLLTLPVSKKNLKETDRLLPDPDSKKKKIRTDLSTGCFVSAVSKINRCFNANFLLNTFCINMKFV